MTDIEPVPGPYLFSVRPVDGELGASYLARLAAVNNLHPRQVLNQIIGTIDGPLVDNQRFSRRRLELNRLALARLAQLSGHSERALLLALTVTMLPGSWQRPVARLRQQRQRRPWAWSPVNGCARCSTGIGIAPMPIIEFRDDRVFCRRHRLWLADQHDQRPFPIDADLELRAAVTLLRRAFRLYGLKTHRAFNAAHAIWATHQSDHGRSDFVRDRWASRAKSLGMKSGVTTLAPRYPDIAALTAMIATPAWKIAAGHRRQDPNDPRPGLTEFLTELGRRIGHPDPGRFATRPGAIGQWALTLRNFHPDRDRLELAGPIDINLHIRRKSLKKAR